MKLTTLSTLSLTCLALMSTLGCSGGAQSPLAPADLQESRDAAGIIPPPCLPPFISAINSAGLHSGSIVSPTAIVSGSVTVTSWNFGGGATPNTSTSRNPTVTLGAPGTYTGSVFMSNACGSHLKPFTYTVVASPWTARSGPVPLNVNAGETSIALFRDRPAMAYYNMTTGDLMYATASNSIPYGAEWTLQTIDSVGNTGRYPQLLMSTDGRPKIVYQDVTNGDLKIAQAIPAVPTQPSDWNLTFIDSAGVVGSSTSATYYTNDILVSYYDQTNQNVKVMGALVGEFPSGPGSWVNLSPMALSIDDGSYSSLKAHNGNMSLAYSSSNGEVRFATSPVSSSPSWTRYGIENAGVTYNQMALCIASNGRPAVAYRNSASQLRIAQANGPAPLFSSDWSIHTAKDAFYTTFVHSMVLSENKLAVSYYGGNANGPHIMIAQTNTATPTSKADWYINPATPGVNASYTSCLLNTTLAGPDQLALSFINGDPNIPGNMKLSFGWRN